MDFNTGYMGFMTYIKLKKYSPRTQDSYRTMLRAFNRYLTQKNITDIRQMTKAEALEYQEQVSKEKVSSGTKSIKIRLARLFYEYLLKESLILINPFENIKITAKKSLPKNILTPREIEKIISYTNISLMTGIRDRTVLELLYSTGIRIDECAHLTVYDVDIKEKLLRIRRGKGAKDRVVPVGVNAAKWMKEYLQRVRPRSNRRKPNIRTLFLSITGSAMISNTIRIMFNRYLKQAKIRKKGITCHSIRHCFATELIKNGANIVHVQKLLGHKNIESTLIYTKVVPIDIKKTHKKTHPREKGKR